MQPTIILDAGHGGFDNGATYQERKEKEDALRLTMQVGADLEEKGFLVRYTRTTDLYQRPADKAQMANTSGADYFVSIHRNSSPTANQYNGVETLVYQDAGVPAVMASAINAQLEQIGFQNLGVSVRPELAVLRRTKMPAVLIEAGFINSDVDNRLFEEKFDAIAQAIADGIAQAVVEISQNSGTKPPGTANHNGAYAVQVGLFRRYENARYLKRELEQKGYAVELQKWKEYFAVVVGREPDIEAAKMLENTLQAQGYDTLIVNVNR